MLENLVRKYSNLKGVYITKDFHVEDLNGCLYEPIIPFNRPSMLTLKRASILHRLSGWCFG